MNTPITSLIAKRDRGQLNKDKVLIVYDTADGTGTDSQYEIANAYRDAYGIAEPIYGVDLSASTSRNQVSMWSAWMDALSQYCVDNDIEAICAPTTFGDASGYLYARGESGSAIATLGCVKAIKAVMDELGGTELSDHDGIIQGLVEHGGTRLTYSGSTYLPGIAAETGDLLGGYYFSGDLYQQKYSGMAGLFTADNSVSLVGEVSYSGVGFGTFLNDTDIDMDYKKKEVAQSCYPTDNYTQLRAQWFLPCWRIGWVTGAEGAPQFTAADCTAMVARSKAAKKSRAWHVKNSIVLGGANDRGGSAALQPSNYCVFDAMCRDVGFDSKFGYAAEGTTKDRLDQVATDTGLTKYDSLNVDFRQTNEAAGSGDTYRELNGGAIQFFAMNGNTFPMRNVLLAYDTTVVNQSYAVNNDWYGGANQGVELSIGAIGTEGTSAAEGKAAAFILNGGSAFYGAIGEPNGNYPAVNNGTAFMTSILRGVTAAEAMRPLNGYQLHFMELMGDGLAQPFFLQSTVNDMIVYKAQEPIYYSKSSNNERGRGFADDGLDWMGTDYRVEIPDSSGVTQVVIAGYQESYVGMTSTEDFRIIIDQTASPSIDATTTPDWPSWLVATFECIAGTYTFDGDTVWDTKTIVTAANGRKYAVFAVDPGAHYFQQQLDPATTGVESWAETTGFTSDAADTGVTYTISGTPTDNGTDVKIVYNDTAKHGPFLLEDTSLNGITVGFPTVSMGKAATTTFVTSASDDIVITDPVTVTYSNTSIASSGGGGSTRIIDHNIIG